MEISSHGFVLCLLFTASLYAYIQFLNPEGFKPSFRLPNHQIVSNKSTNTLFNKTNHEDVLESALSKASTANKTLIIAIVNKAYVEGDDKKPMLDMFLEGFWVGEGTRGLIKHLLLVAVDQTSFERCKFLQLQCFKLETNGTVDFNGEKVYMSEDFINMMWRRTLFLGEVLKRGYSFIFTDTDVLWLRNPFHRLSSNQSIDLQISTDTFNGDPHSKTNPINTGFYMVRSNSKTISLFDDWYVRKDSSKGMKEQDVLQKMIMINKTDQLNLTMSFLDTLYFSGFCQDSKDFRAVTTVHANCCRTIGAKVADLTAVIRDWKRFRSSSISSSSNQTYTRRWSKHTACIHSWRS